MQIMILYSDMKYLLTGRNGQLARSFIRRFEQDSINFLAPDESHLDITNEKTVAEFVGNFRPDVIINCAAFNLVDKAEAVPEIAMRVNCDGPGNLARAAASQNALLMHFGSDYVFDGKKESGLYTEDNPVNPLNEYGKSKLAGEQSVLQESARFLIFRLSWVFGPGKQNFIRKLLEWSQNSDFLRIACDEFSVPTSTETVVDLSLKAVNNGLTGLYHLTNSGYCSRYEWGKLIMKTMGINKFIRPVEMNSFQLPAKRPGFSAMDNNSLSKILDISIPTWEEATVRFLRQGGLDNE
jgi:dTDP-4-dehydrorhamnose reductase